MIVHSAPTRNIPRFTCPPGAPMLLAALALLSALHTAPAAAPAPAPRADSIAGTWQIKGDVMGNPLNTTCTLKQTGAAISGSCTAEGGSTEQIAGEVKDGKIAFWHGGDYNGEALTIVYTLTSVSATELKGTIVVKPFDAGGTFTAAPAPAPAKP